MTEIREPNYTIDLPGEWEQGHTLEEGATLYSDSQGGDTVTVLLLGAKPVYAIADRKVLLEQYMQHRQTFEKGSSGLIQSAPKSIEADDAVEGGWEAFDPETGRKMRHRILLAGSLLADFRYVALDLDALAFDTRAKEILSTATVIPPE